MVSPNSLETLLRFLRLILLQAFIRLQLSKTTPIRQNQLTPPQPRHSQDSPCFVIIKQVENLVDAIPRLFVALSKNFKVGGIYIYKNEETKDDGKDMIKQLLVII